MSFDRRPDRFEDIVENIDRLRDHLTHLDGPLVDNGLIMDATERCLARISEAVSALLRVHVDLDVISDQVPWRAIHDMGNRLRHEYRHVRADLIADVIENKLDALRAVAAAEVERLDREAGL